MTDADRQPGERRPSHDSGAAEHPLLEETIGANLARTVAARPGGEAMVDLPSGQRWTYIEFARDVRRLAWALVAAGIRPGDRVGIWSPNRAEWTLTQYATAEIGAILVTVNPAYRTHELAFVLRQSGMRLLLSAAEHRGSDYRRMVAEARAAARPDAPRLGRAVCFDDETYPELLAGGSEAYEELVSDLAAGLQPGDAINIQYTSGTTGFPKGATLSHRNILNNGFSVGELLGYTPADRICLPVPFYHCFGMVMGNLAATSHGATMVIPSPGFDPAATLAAVAAERATSLYGVPTMFIAELALPDFADYDLRSLRTGIMAGSPCPVEVMRRVVAEMGMTEVAIAYGMTETSPVSTQTRVADDLERRTATVGRVMPHLDIAVVDPISGEVVPRGEPGEFLTRGYSVMLGYWDDPERTAEAIDADGWMHTGDLAVMRDDGYVNVVGRIKDLVIRGGENVYPREVEEFLYTHPDILDVQVVGVPDERYGEELAAWVRLRPGAPALDAAAVREFCDGRLAHFKIPRYVLIVEEFPMTVSGKVRKVVMREESVRLLGLEAAAAARHA